MPPTLQQETTWNSTEAARKSHGPELGSGHCSTVNEAAVARGHLEIHRSGTEKEPVTTGGFPPAALKESRQEAGSGSPV